MHKTSSLIILALVFIAIFTLSSCSKDLQEENRQGTQTPEEIANETPTSTITPTPAPLGSADNPIVIGFVYEEPETQTQAANIFAQFLADKTGMIYKLQSFTTYEELLASMKEGKITLTWLQPLTYLYASQEGIADAAFLTNNYGVYAYGTQFLVRVNSGFQTYFDPKTGNVSSDSDSALNQFAEKRPCFIDDKSIAGYVVPMGLFKEADISIKEPAYLRSYPAAIRAIYAGGICDFTATYALSGDPRTAQSLQPDLPDVMDKVVVLWRTEPIVPTLNLSFATTVDPDTRIKISDAITSFSLTSIGLRTMSQMMNYEIEALLPVSDDVYSDLREIINSSEIDLSSLLGR